MECIEKALNDKKSPVGKINNYRNSSTHRELLHIGYVPGSDHVESYLFEDPEDSKKVNMKLQVKPYCKESLKTMRDFLEGLHSKLSY